MNSCQLVIPRAAGAGSFSLWRPSRTTIDVHGGCVDHSAGQGPTRGGHDSRERSQLGHRVRQMRSATATNHRGPGGRVMGEHKRPGDASVFCLPGSYFAPASHGPSWAVQ
jgi:hypothetical protein